MKIGFKVLWGMPPGGGAPSKVYQMTYFDPDAEGMAFNVPFLMKDNYFPDELLVDAGEWLENLVATVDGVEVAINVMRYTESRFYGRAPEVALLLQLPSVSTEARTVQFQIRAGGRSVPDSNALSLFSSFMVFNHSIEPVYDLVRKRAADLLNSTDYPSPFGNDAEKVYDYATEVRCREGFIYGDYSDFFIDRTQIMTWGYDPETDEDVQITAGLPTGVLGKNPTRFGAASLYEGELYVCAESYTSCASVTDKLILVYDQNTLALKRAIDYTGSEEVSAIVCVNGYLYAVSKCATTSLYRYTLNGARTALSSRTVLTIKSAIKNMEGICAAGEGGRYLLVASDEQYNMRIYCLDTVTLHRWCMYDVSSYDDVDGDHRLCGIHKVGNNIYFGLDSDANSLSTAKVGNFRAGTVLFANPYGPVPMFSTDIATPQKSGAMIMYGAFLTLVSPPGTYCAFGKSTDMNKYQHSLRISTDRRWEGYNTKDGVFTGYDVGIADGSTYGATTSYPAYFFGATTRSVMFGEQTTNGSSKDMTWRHTTGTATYSADGQSLNRFAVLGNGVNTTRQMRGGTVQYAMLMREVTDGEEAATAAVTRMFCNLFDGDDVELVDGSGSSGGDTPIFS